MPVYNGQKFIRDAIDSIINQTYNDWILYISDDSSKDSTPEICLEYTKKDPRIKYTRREKNLGLFGNFGFVLEECSEPYFMWVAQDDLRDPKYLQICMEQFDKDPELDFATTCTACIDQNGKTISLEDELTIFTGKPSVFGVTRYIMHPEILGKCNLMYGLYKSPTARAVWEAYPQRNIWGQDYMFTLALISRFKIFVDKSPLFKKRLGGYSSPKAFESSDPVAERKKLLKDAKNHIFPFGRFKIYLNGHIEALRGTDYGILAVFLLFLRLPRSFIIHIKERDMRKIFPRIRKTLSKIIK